MNPDQFRLALFVLLCVALLVTAHLARYEVQTQPDSAVVLEFDRWTGDARSYTY